jgi:hypothetical protein
MRYGTEWFAVTLITIVHQQHKMFAGLAAGGGDMAAACRLSTRVLHASHACVLQKEIVMYAYYKRLDYFSTECVYAPFAARGFARDFVKDLEVRI